MRQVYLDCSATTPVKPEVLAEMLPFFSEKYGNPSSLYQLGYASHDAIELARARVADLIGASAAEISFTSGGTEADNWAVAGIARANREKGNHIITTAIEHHALLHTCAAMEKEGFEITYLGVDGQGRVNPADLQAAFTDRTILVSIMFANNETGAIQPIDALGRMARERGVAFHTDAVQAVGNTPIDVRRQPIDALSLSAHKIYGPKGVGALYVRSGLPIEPLLYGGAQERRRRAGTENVPGIVGLGKAAELAAANLDEHIRKLTELRNAMIAKLQDAVPNVRVNGDLTHRLPGNINAMFQYVEGEALLLELDIKGIAASTGSACSSATFAPSHVLTAMGLPLGEVYSSLRFSLGDFTTMEEIDYAVAVLRDAVTRLRAFSPYGQGQEPTTAQSACSASTKRTGE